MKEKILTRSFLSENPPRIHTQSQSSLVSIVHFILFYFLYTFLSDETVSSIQMILFISFYLYSPPPTIHTYTHKRKIFVILIVWLSSLALAHSLIVFYIKSVFLIDRFSEKDYLFICLFVCFSRCAFIMRQYLSLS